MKDDEDCEDDAGDDSAGDGVERIHVLSSLGAMADVMAPKLLF